MRCSSRAADKSRASPQGCRLLKGCFTMTWAYPRSSWWPRTALRTCCTGALLSDCIRPSSIASRHGSARKLGVRARDDVLARA